MDNYFDSARYSSVHAISPAYSTPAHRPSIKMDVGTVNKGTDRNVFKLTSGALTDDNEASSERRLENPDKLFLDEPPTFYTEER